MAGITTSGSPQPGPVRRSAVLRRGTGCRVVEDAPYGGDREWRVNVFARASRYHPGTPSSRPSANMQLVVHEAVPTPRSRGRGTRRIGGDPSYAIPGHKPVAAGSNQLACLGSTTTLPTAATLYRLVGSCKRHQVDPFASRKTYWSGCQPIPLIGLVSSRPMSGSPRILTRDARSLHDGTPSRSEIPRLSPNSNGYRAVTLNRRPGRAACPAAGDHETVSRHGDHGPDLLVASKDQHAGRTRIQDGTSGRDQERGGDLLARRRKRSHFSSPDLTNSMAHRSCTVGRPPPFPSPAESGRRQ